MKTVDSGPGTDLYEEGIPTTEPAEKTAPDGGGKGSGLDMDPVKMVIYSEILSPKWK